MTSSCRPFDMGVRMMEHATALVERQGHLIAFDAAFFRHVHGRCLQRSKTVLCGECSLVPIPIPYRTQTGGPCDLVMSELTY